MYFRHAWCDSIPASTVYHAQNIRHTPKLLEILAHSKRIRARKLYTSARIYEWKFGKGEWKLSFASPTGRVDFFGFVIIL